MADRIDQLADGGLAIVDYKTGTPPGPKAVAEGYAMQLGLLGLIAERKGFEGIQGVPACFEYWSLARKAGRLGYVASPVTSRGGIDVAESTTMAARNFLAAAARWLTGDEPFTAKLHPEHAPHGDYDQLMRLHGRRGRAGGRRAGVCGAAPGACPLRGLPPADAPGRMVRAGGVTSSQRRLGPQGVK